MLFLQSDGMSDDSYKENVCLFVTLCFCVPPVCICSFVCAYFVFDHLNVLMYQKMSVCLSLHHSVFLSVLILFVCLHPSVCLSSLLYFCLSCFCLSISLL